VCTYQDIAPDSCFDSLGVLIALFGGLQLVLAQLPSECPPLMDWPVDSTHSSPNPPLAPLAPLRRSLAPLMPPGAPSVPRRTWLPEAAAHLHDRRAWRLTVLWWCTTADLESLWWMSAIGATMSVGYR
jgi:hypothetical protein